MKSVTEWVFEQFLEERCRRWLDGSRGKLRHGYCSFVQVLDYSWEPKENGRWRRMPYPQIWSVVHCSAPGGFRWTYYLKVRFYSAQGDDVLAKLEMKSAGIYSRFPARTVESEITFGPRENAPKKLNREIRRLRAQMLSSSST